MILVSNSTLSKHNTNPGIAFSLSRGFAELLGSEAVRCVDILEVSSAVERLRPTLVLLVGSPASMESDFREIGAVCRKNNACFVFWTVEDPYEIDFNERFLPYTDFVFTNDLNAVSYYNRTNVFHLPLAADASIKKSNISQSNRALDIFFCGVAYPNRQVLIYDLLDILQQRKSLIVGVGWPKYGGQSVSHKRISPQELFELYGQSRFVLNVGRSFSIANSRHIQPVTPGPRTFEAALVGCVQFYHRPGASMSRYFRLDEEIIGFDTIAEFREQYDALTADQTRAERIAKAAQHRAIAEHTYKERAKEILTKIGASANVLPIRDQ